LIHELVLDFNAYSLYGIILPEIGVLSNVSVLSLRGNTLSGTIPSEIGTYLPNSVSLRLSDNRLIGSIPSEQEQLTDLRVFTLHTNSLTGSIPTEIGSLSNLSQLDIIHDNTMLLLGDDKLSL